jgi:hypothetical protein
VDRGCDKYPLWKKQRHESEGGTSHSSENPAMVALLPADAGVIRDPDYDLLTCCRTTDKLIARLVGREDPGPFRSRINVVFFNLRIQYADLAVAWSDDKVKERTWWPRGIDPSMLFSLF